MDLIKESAINLKKVLFFHFPIEPTSDCSSFHISLLKAWLSASLCNISLGVATVCAPLSTYFLGHVIVDISNALLGIKACLPSGQICFSCESLHPEMKNLANRTMACDCGLTISRDQNAAINIKREGLRILKSKSSIA